MMPPEWETPRHRRKEEPSLVKPLFVVAAGIVILLVGVLVCLWLT